MLRKLKCSLAEYVGRSTQHPSFGRYLPSSSYNL